MEYLTARRDPEVMSLTKETAGLPGQFNEASAWAIFCLQELIFGRLSLPRAFWEIERAVLVAALVRSGRCKSAYVELGIARSSLGAKLRKYGISRRAASVDFRLNNNMLYNKSHLTES